MKAVKHFKKRKLKKGGRKAGLPPGSLIKQVGEFSEIVELTYFLYNAEEIEEEKFSNISELAALNRKNKTLWVNVSGLNNTEILKELGEMFDLHPLLLEDILNTDQRPKMDDFGDSVALTLRMLYHHQDTKEIEDEQITLILGEGFILSFQEMVGDVFDSVRERLRNSGGRIRKSGSDYLAYALTDVIVDQYFVMIEDLGEKVEVLEDEVFDNPSHEHYNRIHSLKREMIIFRKNIFPLREAISQIQKTSKPFVHIETQRFFSDVYDHVIHVLDLVESYRELNSGLKDIYFSSLSIQMNKVIQLLTIISTIFIPLTFIAGVYGMNFENMPELSWKNGYYFVLGFMLLVVVFMLLFFRRRKWL